MIVDIDGTIAKPGARLQHLRSEPKNWDAFYADCFDDEPITENIELVKHLSRKYEIVYCTGRRESCRAKTTGWFDKYELPYDNKKLLMRANGDKRHDTVAKPILVQQAGIGLEQIAFVLEDRNSMVGKWRELGVPCFQVAEGDF